MSKQNNNKKRLRQVSVNNAFGGILPLLLLPSWALAIAYRLPIVCISIAIARAMGPGPGPVDRQAIGKQ